MQENTGTKGSRAHIDTLQVRHGYAFAVTPIESRVLGGGRRQRDAEVWDEMNPTGLYFPAGRGA